MKFKIENQCMMLDPATEKPVTGNRVFSDSGFQIAEIYRAEPEHVELMCRAPEYKAMLEKFVNLMAEHNNAGQLGKRAGKKLWLASCELMSEYKRDFKTDLDLVKSLGYAYAGSPFANKRKHKNGCWYVTVKPNDGEPAEFDDIKFSTECKADAVTYFRNCPYTVERYSMPDLLP